MRHARRIVSLHRCNEETEGRPWEVFCNATRPGRVGKLSPVGGGKALEAEDTGSSSYFSKPRDPNKLCNASSYLPQELKNSGISR